MSKKSLIILFALLLVVDTSYTFFQHFTTALDGDLIPIVMPADHYKPILQDPFGLAVIRNDATYAAPNRFFVHWFMYHYFGNVPHLLQEVGVPPIDSLYAAAALAKTGFHLLLILLLAKYVQLLFKDKNTKYVFFSAAVLIAPFFQYAFFGKVMGVVDLSITYACFYAFPIALLSLFFLPFFRNILTTENQQMTWQQHLLTSILLIILPFSGPLIAGLAPIIIGVIFLYLLNRNTSCLTISDLYQGFRAIPLHLKVYFILLTLLCFYSVYIGRNNIENSTAELPLLSRYARLPIGIGKLMTTKIGLSLLLASVLINSFILKKINTNQSRQILRIEAFILLGSLLYLFFLPLGGYREYRADIVRYDTFIPVTLGLIFCFGISAYYLLHHYQKWKKYGYTCVIVGLLGFYTLADEPYFSDNFCERAALEKIANSDQEITILTEDCLVISWVKDTGLGATDIKSRFLKMMNITREEKLYYQE